MNKKILSYVIAVAITLLLTLFLCYPIARHQPPYHTNTLDSITLNGGTFHTDVTVFMCQNPTPALEFVQQNIDSAYTPKDFDASGVTFYKRGYPITIWLPKVPETPWDISVANHELLHAAVAILNTAGISFSDSTEEVYSYELGHLSEQFYGHTKNKFGSFNNPK